MKIIGITSELEGIEETSRIVEALDAGVSYIHLRKPYFTDDDMRKYIKNIPKEYYQRLTLASNPALFKEFNLGGIHIKRAQFSGSECHKGIRRSISCHSTDEVILHQGDDLDYMFLSPIFDSISKKGYSSHFSLDELGKLSELGLLRKVVALGGINCINTTQLREFDIYGVAVLGFLFGDMPSQEFKQRLNQLTSTIQ